MSKKIKQAMAAAGLLVAAGASMAATAPPDMTGLTSAVDFSTVTTAVLAIAGLLAVVYVAVKGARIGLSMLKGG